MTIRPLSPLGILVASVLMASSVSAQPAPTLTASSHPWVTRGTTVELTLTGDHLAEARKVMLDGPAGITADLVAPAPGDKPNPKSLKVKLILDPAAPQGERELRIVTPSGVSNKVDVNVTALPVVGEVEPNNTLAQGQAITLPATINGLINGGADIDTFKFAAKKGQRLVFEVFAQRMGSALDSSLKLFNAAGREVARSEDAIGTDSLIAYEIPDDGTYLIQVSDLQYRGGGNYPYRINAGAIPYARAAFPMGGKRGTIVDVQLTGWNLPSATIKVDLTNKPAGRTQVFATPDGAANPLAFEVSDQSEYIETEPNQEHPKGNVLAAVPVVVNGVIDQPGDIDYFRFKLDKPMKLRLAIDAMRLGSSLDALLAVHDAAGNAIARTDDAAPGSDAVIERDFAPGEYSVSVMDLTNLGGPTYGYRLSIAPPVPVAPDFSIRFFPDTIRLHRGGRTVVQCEVFRTGGFGGAVTVALSNPPKGVTAKPAEIAAGPVSGLFVVEAAADADLTSGSLQLVATGVHGETKIVRTAQPLVRIEPVLAAYVTVLDAAPFAVNQAKPPTEEEVQRIVGQIAALETQLLAANPELDAAQPAWEMKLAQTIAGAVAMGQWQYIGPFKGANFDDAYEKAFEPEKEIDLKKTYGALKWVAKPQWVDGTVYNDFPDGISAHYIYRTIEVAADRSLELSLGSDDAIKVFHNGTQVLANKTQRGAAPDQEKVTLKLKAGVNHLLIKVVNGAASGGHYFKANAATHGVPAALVAAVEAPADKRTPEQKAALLAAYRDQAAPLAPVREQIAALRKRIGTREEVAQLRRKLATHTPELDAAQAAWEKSAMSDTWSTLEFTEMKSTGGATFTRQKDGSLLLGGPAQAKDTYTLTANTDLKNITAIRIEALADKSLGGGGPGRADNGNFVLSKFAILAAPRSDATKTRPVQLHTATATFEQGGFPLAGALDDDDETGWAVHPNMGQNSSGLILVKDFKGDEGGTVLTLTLRCQSQHVKHTLGRFRISLTTHAKPDMNQPSLPGPIVKLIQTPADKRNAKQKSDLAAYYRSIAPSLDADRGRLAALEAAGLGGTPTMKYNQTATVAFEVSRAAGFTGDITVSALGFAAGRDAQGNPNLITKDLEAPPVVLKGDAASGTITFKAKDKSEVGTRTLVLVAESMVNGQKVTQVSETIAVTVTP
jgi:hypothetical protein